MAMHGQQLFEGVINQGCNDGADVCYKPWYGRPGSCTRGIKAKAIIFLCKLPTIKVESSRKGSLSFLTDCHPGIRLAGDRVECPVKRRTSGGVWCALDGP